MSFQSPLALIALVVVPLLVVAYVLRERARRAEEKRFGNPTLVSTLVHRPPSWRRHLPLAVLLVALTAMVVGVARPQATVSEPREEATVILAVDVSRSMTATDVKPSRLAAARAAAEAFLQRVPEKFRVGLVAFGARAVVSAPPTTNRQFVSQALESLRSGSGTALGDAIKLSAQLGQRQRARDGSVPPTAVLLISDGAPMGGRTSPRAAARRAKALHVPIYTVLVGTPNGVVHVPLTGGFEEQIKVPPSPGTLRLVANESGGQFFTATNDQRLKEIYERLGSRLGSTKVRREMTDAFAGGSAVLLLVGGALSTLWFRRVV